MQALVAATTTTTSFMGGAVITAGTLLTLFLVQSHRSRQERLRRWSRVVREKGRVKNGGDSDERKINN